MYTKFDSARSVTEQDILLALKEEETAIAYYTVLVEMAGANEDVEEIEHILADERRHVVMLHKIYRRLYGREPKVPAAPRPTVITYDEGLSAAIRDEWDAYETYRDLILLSDDRRLMRAFFEMMTDENEHAGRLSRLYAENDL